MRSKTVKKAWREIVALALAVLLVFGAGFGLGKAFPDEGGTVFATDLDRHEIDRFAITEGEETFTLERDGQEWSMKGNNDFLVDSDKVSSALKTLCRLTAMRKVENPGKDKEYGLDTPQRVLELGIGDETTTILIGDNNVALRSTYVKVNEDLYLIDPVQFSSLGYDYLAYAKDAGAASVRYDNVNRVSVKAADRSFVIRPYNPEAKELYTDAYEWVIEDYLEEPLGADSELSYQLIELPQRLSDCERFAYKEGTKGEEGYNLDTPVMEVVYDYTATSYEGTKSPDSLTLIMGIYDDALYAHIKGEQVAYRLSDDLASLVTYLSTPTAFISTTLFAVEPATVKGLTIKTGSKTYDIEIEDPSFEKCTVNGKEADGKLVANIVGLLTSIQVYGFAKETSEDADLTVEIRRDFPGFETVDMTFSENGTDFYNVAFGPVDNYLINKNFVMNLENMLKDL